MVSDIEKDQRLVIFLDSLGEGADVDFARSMLEAHDWNLEAAVLSATSGDPHSNARSDATPVFSPNVDDDGYRAPMRTGYQDQLIGGDEDFYTSAFNAAVNMMPNERRRSGAPGRRESSASRRVLEASAADFDREADLREQAQLAEALEVSYAEHCLVESVGLSTAAAPDVPAQAPVGARHLIGGAPARQATTQRSPPQGAALWTTSATTEDAAGPKGSSLATPVVRPQPQMTSASDRVPLVRSRPASGQGVYSAVGVAQDGTTVVVMPKFPVPSNNRRPHMPLVSATARSDPVESRPSSGVLRDQTAARPSGNPQGPRRNGVPRAPPLTTASTDARSATAEACPASLQKSAAPYVMPKQSRVVASAPSPTGQALDARPTVPKHSSPSFPVPQRSIVAAARIPPSAAIQGREVRQSALEKSPPSDPAAQRIRALARPENPEQPGQIQRPSTKCPPPAVPATIVRSSDEVQQGRQRCEQMQAVRDTGRDAARLPRQGQQQTDCREPPSQSLHAPATIPEARGNQRQHDCATAADRAHEQEQIDCRRRAVADAQQKIRQRQTEEIGREKPKAQTHRPVEEADAEVNRREAVEQEALRRQRQQADAEAKCREADAESRRREAMEEEALQRERDQARQMEADRVVEPELKRSDPVVEALCCLKKRYKDSDPEGLQRCLQTLRAYINNLARNPTETKFQRINCQNSAFQTRVARLEGSIAVLEACGFVREGEGTLAVTPEFVKSKGPRLWDALAKVDVMLDSVKS